MDKNNRLHSSFPKWLRVKEQLRNEILSGWHGLVGSPFITVRTVAKQCGISLATAQKVATMLKKDGLLTPGGKRLLVARTDDSAAGRKKVLRIGMIVANLDSPFFASLLKNAELATNRHGIELISTCSNYDLSRERQKLEMMIASGATGILACPANDVDSAPNFTGLELPFVLLGRRIEGIDADSVLVQNFSAGQAVARHLCRCGKTDFGYIGVKNFVRDPRMQGFRAGLAENGFKLGNDKIVLVDNNNIDSSSTAIGQLAGRLNPPSGIFCFHDLIASLLLRLAIRNGISVPEHLAVVGFDNLPVALELTPSLTSMDYPIDQMAETALELLMKRMNGSKSRPVVNYLEPTLVIRESTAGNAFAGQRLGQEMECLTYNLA